MIAILDNEVTIEIDIKPGSDLNPVNLLNRGIIPVAILGSTPWTCTTSTWQRWHSVPKARLPPRFGA